MENAVLYDNDNKLQFLKSIGHMLPTGEYKRAGSKRIMTLLSKEEQRNDTPFYHFDEKQTLEFLQQILGSRSGAYSDQTLSFLRRYIRWCEMWELISTKEMNMHPIMTFSTSPRAREALRKQLEIADIFEDFRNTMLCSYNEFVTFCELFFSSSRNEMDRAICCLSWLGFTADQIRYIELADFNSQTRMIAGVKIEEDYIFKTLQTVAVSSCYTNEDSEYPNRVYYYNDTKYLLRSTRRKNASNASNNAVSLVTIRTLQARQEEIAKRIPSTHPLCTKRLTSVAIMRSGIYWRLYQKQTIAAKELTADELALSQFSSYLKWKRCFYPDYPDA